MAPDKVRPMLIREEEQTKLDDAIDEFAYKAKEWSRNVKRNEDAFFKCFNCG